MVASGRMRAPLRRLVAVMTLAALLVGPAGCSDPAPVQLSAMLDVMPATAGQRGLYYSDLRAEHGFGSALPLRRANAVVGVDVFDAVLETGGAPLTVLAGDIRPRRVIDAVQQAGYLVEEADEDWIAFRRARTSDAGPFAAAVPAGAVQRDLLVLGSPEEVRAAIDGDTPVAEVPGAARLLDALGPAHAVAMLLSPDRILDAAREAGGVRSALDRGGAQGELPEWDAAALSWGDPGDPDATGTLLLALDVDAEQGHEAARALVLRAATTPLLGDGRRATAQLFDRGAPRWDPERGVVRLPVRWTDDDPTAVRADLDAATLLFLAPAP